MKKVKLYALSTCGWCKRTKRFLDEHDVDYECEHVDLLSGDEKDRFLGELAQWNPKRTYPTIVIDDSHVIVGFRTNRLREALGL